MKNEKSTRRSEKIRRRLDQESKAWVNKAADRLTDPQPAVSPRVDKNGKLNLSTNPPAQKHNHLFRVGWRLVSFILVGFFCYALFTAWTSPAYKVAQVNISGLQRLTKDEVLSNIDLIGKHIFSLNTLEIKTNLQRKYPELWDIKILLSLPAQVTIRLVERQPMIAWSFDDSLIWIDAEGYLIPCTRGNRT